MKIIINNRLSKMFSQSLLLLIAGALSTNTNAQLGPDGVSVATMSDYSVVPELLADGADPLLLIDLSVELTQQAESYTGATEVLAGGNVCPGRRNVTIGSTSYSADICYTNAEEYIGYFDPKKCYVYDTSGADTSTEQTSTSPNSTTDPHFFRPSSLADSNYECGGSEFSGNYMNWATMTAIDQFRYAMTGGARILDTAGASATTLLTRTNRSSWRFVNKVISSAGLSGSTSGTTYTFTNTPGQLTPFSSAGALRAESNNSSRNRVSFYDGSNSLLGTYNVIVKACDSSTAEFITNLEDNCVEYTDGTNTWYKPEGLLLENALKMKYGLFSYLADNSHQRNGGVLRVAAKYIGTKRPTDNGGFESNPNAEVDEEGLVILDPDGLTATAGVNNSGLLNYINNFGLGPNRYKGFDPVAELYYESLRYLVANDGGSPPTQLSPTPEYTAITNTNQYDNFPVITTWDDPITENCQANYVLYSGDQFAWEDHNLPGMASSIYDYDSTAGRSGNEGDPHLPSTGTIFASGVTSVSLTDDVGTLQGFTNGASSLGMATRGRNNNGWWFAGLSYWANTTDIRPDRDTAQYVKTFVVDTQEYQSGGPGTGQDNPLWLAAKYGGFDNEDEDDNPNTAPNDLGISEPSSLDWDADADGTPDSYTLGNQPAAMVVGLRNVFDEVEARVASGSAAAVQAGSSRGIGAFYQALYEPQIIVGNEAVQWVGSLHAWFIDDDGKFYEDTCDTDLAAGPGNCDKVYTEDDDFEIRTRFDADKDQLVVDRYNPLTGSLAASNPSVPVREVSSLWSAHDELSDLSDVTTQRAYGSPSDTGRYIFTWIDSDLDNKVDGGIVNGSAEAIPFDSATFTGTDVDQIERYLGLDSTTLGDAPDLVDYIRGEDGVRSDWRSRTIDADGSGAAEVMRLGDIVHSSPVTVGRPNEGYGLRYSDETYTEFRNHYADRRVMVYAGANDGMLHAFNGGFYDVDTDGFTTASSGKTEHPLGGEVWAYVPQNLLPHLRWLTQPNYSHVYYVDGSPKVFDVNAFTEDADHPGGWGTILVVGFRLGGGEQTIDPNSDITDGDSSDDIIMRSAYAVFDITNPENPPELLAEFTGANSPIGTSELGFTSAEPAVFVDRDLSASTDGSFGSVTDDKWYLVMGSGPAGSTAVEKDLALRNFESSQAPQVYIMDLKTKSEISGSPFLADNVNGFIGGFIAADWSSDFIDDVLYFGTVSGDIENPSGKLRRLAYSSGFSSGNFSTLFTGQADEAFSHTPLILKDLQGNHWVFAGAGRLLASGDLYQFPKQHFYAIKESVGVNGIPNFSGSVFNETDLVNVSDINVYADGSVTRGSMDTTPTTVNGTSIQSFGQLELALRGANGWYRALEPDGYRVTLQPGIAGTGIFYSAVSPTLGNDVCEVSGDSRVYLADFTTGTPSPDLFVVTDTVVLPGSKTLLDPYKSIDDAILVGSTQVGDKIVTIDEVGQAEITEGSSVSSVSGRMSWREILLN